MASFKEINFTPAEFGRIAKLSREQVSEVEKGGLLKVGRTRVGNVDRKFIPLESVQNYFRGIRKLEADMMNSPNPASVATATGAEAIGPMVPVEALEKIGAESVAVATAFNPGKPTHKIQMFYNVKGGTGKSTLTAQFVMRASLLGYKVLALDLDGQGHLGVNLDVMDTHERPTLYDVLINDLPIEQAIYNVAPGLDLVPSNLGLCNIEIPLNQKTRREYRLSEAIERVADQYDLIIADTNPTASILNCSMLVACERVNIVCATNPLSFHGMSLVMATIEAMEKEFRKTLDVRIIPNMYDNREVISQEVLGELRAQFPESCTKTVVNRSADLNEATKRRTTVLEVNQKGTAAQDISGLAEELILS